MPEPLSAQLRRLHEEATTVCLCGLPTCNRCRGRSTAKLQLRNALPALADLVKFVEALADDNACHWQPMHERGERADCVGCCASGALAALRERLGARP